MVKYLEISNALKTVDGDDGGDGDGGGDGGDGGDGGGDSWGGVAARRLATVSVTRLGPNPSYLQRLEGATLGAPVALAKGEPATMAPGDYPYP